MDASPASPALPAPLRSQQTHSSSLAASSDGSLLFVVHPDADSVSVLSVATRGIVHEIPLASAAPTLSATGRYEPSVGPRALATDSVASTLYVTGQRSGRLYAIDVASGAVARSKALCSEPIGVLVSAADDARVFVACAQDDELVESSVRAISPFSRPSPARASRGPSRGRPTARF